MRQHSWAPVAGLPARVGGRRAPTSSLARDGHTSRRGVNKEEASGTPLKHLRESPSNVSTSLWRCKGGDLGRVQKNMGDDVGDHDKAVWKGCQKRRQKLSLAWRII